MIRGATAVTEVVNTTFCHRTATYARRVWFPSRTITPEIILVTTFQCSPAEMENNHCPVVRRFYE